MSMEDMMREVARSLGGVQEQLSRDREEIYVQVPGIETPVFRAIKEPKRVSEKTRGAGYEGRGPTGRFRNYVQMDDDKLLRVYEQVRLDTQRGTFPDDEALAKMREELTYRKWLAGQWADSA